MRRKRSLQSFCNVCANKDICDEITRKECAEVVHGPSRGYFIQREDSDNPKHEQDRRRLIFEQKGLTDKEFLDRLEIKRLIATEKLLKI